MLSSVAKIAGLALVVYLAVIVGMYLIQRRMMYFPSHDLPPPPAGLTEVRLETADGLDLVAWYAPPRENRHTIVYFHGNGGDISGRVHKTRDFVIDGYGLLLVEYRGYGGNPGEPTEAGLLADGRAALAFLAGQGIEPAQLVFLGESLGSGVAVRLGAETPPAALILEAPFTSAADVGQRAYPWLPVKWLIKDRFDSLSHIAKVRAPLLVVHGERDGVVPVELGKRLFAAANDPKRAVYLPDAGHNDLTAFGLVGIELGFLAELP